MAHLSRRRDPEEASAKGLLFLALPAEPPLPAVADGRKACPVVITSGQNCIERELSLSWRWTGISLILPVGFENSVCVCVYVHTGIVSDQSWLSVPVVGMAKP